MNANHTIDSRPTDDKTLDAVLDAAERYEPTPQEVRWGLIEHHARKALGMIQAGGAIGMTYETRMALADLAGVAGVRFDPEADAPLVKR